MYPKRIGFVLVVALAVAAYHSDEGRYPNQLDTLAPRYLKHIPRDVFGGQPLRYQRTNDGCLIYSLGNNCQDDGGVSSNDVPPADDLRISLKL